MILSGKNKDWSVGYSDVIKCNMYLGCTSLSDLYKATHKVVAYITSPVDPTALFSVAFEEALALPKPPTSFNVISQSIGNGQYYDGDLQPILFDGSIIGTTNATYPASLVLDLVYGETHTFTSMSPVVTPNCSYMYSQAIKFDVYNDLALVASVTNSRLYSASPQTVWSTGWSSALSALGNRVRLTFTATYNAAYSVSKVTMAQCLPIHADLAVTSVPTYGMLLDPLTGSATFLSNLYVDGTAIQSVDVF